MILPAFIHQESATLYQYELWPGLLTNSKQWRAAAEYLSRDLPYKLSADDVNLTLG